MEFLPTEILTKIFYYIGNFYSLRKINKRFYIVIKTIYSRNIDRFNEISIKWSYNNKYLLMQLICEENLDLLNFYYNNYKNEITDIFIMKYCARYNKMHILYTFNFPLEYNIIARNAAKGNNMHIIKICELHKKLHYNWIAANAAKYGFIEIIKYCIYKGANEYFWFIINAEKNGHIDKLKNDIGNYIPYKYFEYCNYNKYVNTKKHHSNNIYKSLKYISVETLINSDERKYQELLAHVMQYGILEAIVYLDEKYKIDIYELLCISAYNGHLDVLMYYKNNVLKYSKELLDISINRKKYNIVKYIDELKI